jgi:hypothetical protein
MKAKARLFCAWAYKNNSQPREKEIGPELFGYRYSLLSITALIVQAGSVSVVVFQLFCVDFLLVQRPPCIGDVSYNKWYKQADVEHCA